MRLLAHLPYIKQRRTTGIPSCDHVGKLDVTERAIRHAYALISRQEVKKCWYEKVFEFFSPKKIFNIDKDQN